MKHKIGAFIFIAIMGIVIFPMQTFAFDWSLGVNSNGDAAVCVGSQCDLSNNNSTFAFSSFLDSNPYGLPSGRITDIITNILNWLLAMLGIFGVIGFVISGIFYLTAAGNDDQIKKAKKAMEYSIYGIITGLAGFVIIQAVYRMLSASGNF